MPEKNLKLWVYDTKTLLGVYAESKDGADAQAHQHGELIGVDFELATDWETYQREHEKSSNA